MAEVATAAQTVAARARIGGVDAARALAVVGMVMVHVGPSPRRAVTLAERLWAVPHGRASVLFVLLAGVGVSLLDRGPRARTVARLLWRALVLLPLGLALQPLDHGALVILQYYALYFVVACVALPLGDRALLTAAVGVTVVGPVLRLALWQAQPQWFAVGPTSLGDPPPVVVRNLIVSGSYPVVTWAAPLLFGMWLGRRDLRAPEVRAAMAAAGAATAVAAGLAGWLLEALLGAPAEAPSWTQLVTARAHSEMPLWLVQATAIAATVLAACLVACDRRPRLLRPLVALGQLALTVYVAHLLVLAFAPGWLARDDVVGAAASVLRFAVVAAAAAAAWTGLVGRGPLEVLLRAPADLLLRGVLRAGPPGVDERGARGSARKEPR